MTTITETHVAATTRVHPLARIVRLHSINPSVFFGIPMMILAGAWIVTVVIALIMQGNGISRDAAMEGLSYSWAVVSPQWYLVVVGVQAIATTFPLALGFGATRRDFWLGTSAMFVLVAALMGAVTAVLVQIEAATDGWWIGAGMFTALWYQADWVLDFYSTFCLQLLVFFVGAAVTTVYMRWQMRGMLLLAAGAAVVGLTAIATITFGDGWPEVWAFVADLGVAGTFTIALAAAALCWAAGYLVIRRATTR